MQEVVTQSLKVKVKNVDIWQKQYDRNIHRYNANWPKMSETFMNELLRLIGDSKELGILKEAIDTRAFRLIICELNCCFFVNPIRCIIEI